MHVLELKLAKQILEMRYGDYVTFVGTMQGGLTPSIEDEY